MASLAPSLLDEEEEKKTTQTSNAPSTGSGPSGVIGAGTSNIAQGGQDKASTGFVNFQTYLDANQDTVEQSRQDLANRAESGVDSAAKTIQDYASSDRAALDQAGQDTFGMKPDDPMSRPWQSEAQKKYDAVNSFEQDNNAWDNAAKAWQSARGAVQDLGTSQGNSKALREFYIKPSYTSGENALDTALIGADKTRFKSVQDKARGYGDLVTDSKRDVVSRKQELQDLWNPKNFESRPVLSDYGYNQELVDQASGDELLDRTAINNLMGSEQSMRQAVESGDLGPKALAYLQDYLGQVAPVADEQDYRYDLQAGQGLYDQGVYDSLNAGGLIKDQGEFQTAQSSLDALQNYIGGQEVNERAKDELTEVEQRLRDTLSGNSQKLVNYGLAQAGYDDQFSGFVSDAITNDQPVSPAHSRELSRQYEQLSQAAANAWDPEAKKALERKAFEVGQQLNQSEGINAYYDYFAGVESQFKIPTGAIQDAVRALDAGQQLSPGALNQVSELLGYAQSVGAWPQNPIAAERAKKLAEQLGVRQTGSQGAYVPEAEVIQVQPEQGPPPAAYGGIY